MKKTKSLLIVLCISLFSSYAQQVVPVKTNEKKYGFTNRNLYFEVDTALAGRISSWKIDGSEFMFCDWSNSLLSGSTFWPSPQSVWNWPPPTALDSKPFKSKVVDKKLYCFGSKDSKTNLAFTKIFYADTTDTSITIKYIIKNLKSTTQKWAPWEITRVPHEGLTFFALGEGSVTGNMAELSSEANGYIWYDQDNTSATNSANKFFCDGKGWLAHVNSSRQIFIKVFADIAKAKAAPGEAEIEIYTNPDNSYTELENQGAYVEIPSNDSIIWVVKWYLRNLPQGITVAASDPGLISYAESFAKRPLPSSVSEKLASNEIKVFPVPANQILKISLGEYTGANIAIYNINGQNILNQKLAEREVTLDISSLKGGMYVYELQTSNMKKFKGNFLVE